MLNNFSLIHCENLLGAQQSLTFSISYMGGWSQGYALVLSLKKKKKKEEEEEGQLPSTLWKTLIEVWVLGLFKDT